MSTIKTIRNRLRMTQAALAEELGVSQGNVSFYERGQTIPPPVAAKLADLATARGLQIGLDHVYGRLELPPVPEPTTADASEG